MEHDRSGENAWFVQNEQKLLEAAKKAREKREAERAAKEEEEQRRKLKELHFMRCPKCGHEMVEEELFKVTIDRCSFCEGVYLDAGELDEIMLAKDEDRKGLFRKLVGF